MVRNFKMVKVRPLRPTRFCRKRTGPGEVNRTAAATASKMGISTGRASTTQTQSKMRFAAEHDQALGSWEWVRDTGFAFRSRIVKRRAGGFPTSTLAGLRAAGTGKKA